MFAVVEQQHPSALPQTREYRCPNILARDLPRSHHPGDGTVDVLRGTHLVQRHEPRARVWIRGPGASDLEREARLADSPGPHERHDRGSVECRLDPPAVVVAPDQTRQRPRECTRCILGGDRGRTRCGIRRRRVAVQQDRRLAEDGRLDLPEARPRVHTEFVDEVAAGHLEGRQRVGLPAGAIERHHEQLPEPLPEGMTARELGQVGKGVLGVIRDALAEVALHGPEPALDQPVHGRLEGRGLEAGQRRAAPLGHSCSGVPCRQVALEPRHVDGCRVHVQLVGRADAHDGRRPDGLAESHHVGLQGLVGRAWRVVIPDRTDQLGHGDRGAG